jgi:hypothetical protein
MHLDYFTTPQEVGFGLKISEEFFLEPHPQEHFA